MGYSLRWLNSPERNASIQEMLLKGEEYRAMIMLKDQLPIRKNNSNRPDNFEDVSYRNITVNTEVIRKMIFRAIFAKSSEERLFEIAVAVAFMDRIVDCSTKDKDNCSDDAPVQKMKMVLN